MNNIFLGKKQFLIWFLLLISPLIVFYPIVFQGYTFSQSPYAYTDKKTFGDTNTLTVADPAASAYQDEPWLVFIKRNLATGEIPLINMNNGLGAPFLESLQPGVFYILNPLLLLLDTSGPVFFDIFILIHIYILLISLYLLFSLYSRKEIALSVAILISFSGVTFNNLNMVHFRGFVWLPLMLVAAINIARGVKSRKFFILLFLSMLAGITAGNIQDFITSLGTVIIVFIVELWTQKRFSDLYITGYFLAGMVPALLVGSLSVLPYLMSMTEGNLFSVADPQRSIKPVPLIWMLNWIIPKINGFYPYTFTQPYYPIHQSDFTSVGVLLVIFTVLLILVHQKSSLRSKKTVLSLILIITISFLKFLHPPIFDFIKYIPLLNGILYQKYHLFLYVLLGMIIAIGFELINFLSVREKQKFLVLSFTLFTIILIFIVSYLYSNPNWSIRRDIPSHNLKEVFLIWSVSATMVLLIVNLLYWWSPKNIWLLLALLFIFQGVLLRPFGYHLRADQYPTIKQDDTVENFRILSSIKANDNLFSNIESVGVFDPVSNRYFRKYLISHFDVLNPSFNIQVSPSLGLTAEQLDALRLIGVNKISGYQTKETYGIRKIQEKSYEIKDSLPRIFLLSKNSYDQITSEWNKVSLSTNLERIREESKKYPLITNFTKNANGINFRITSDFNGVLVVNQAFSTNWSLNKEEPNIFAELFPSWNVSLKKDIDYKIIYWPKGLTFGIVFAVIGLLIILVVYFRIPKLRKK